MLIVWLIGLAFADTIREIPFVGFLYNGIKIASALIIAVRYLCNCLIELNKYKKNIVSEFRQAPKQSADLHSDQQTPRQEDK